MTVERTAKVNALTALLRSVDLGLDARKPLTDTQITEISHWCARRGPSLRHFPGRGSPAKRITVLDGELKHNRDRTHRGPRGQPRGAPAGGDRHRPRQRRRGLQGLVAFGPGAF